MASAATSTLPTLSGEDDGDQPVCLLLVIEGPDMGRAVDLEPGAAVTVGSGGECDLVLADGRVSRSHFRVEASGGRFVVRDLDSTNGTRAGGAVVTEVTVPAGTTIGAGRTRLRIQPRQQAVEAPPSQSRRLGELVGESLAMREVFAVLELAAAAGVTVLLEGETGTGKELAARAVHELSSRRRGPFVPLNCGALPEGTLESELFGHVRGAFTGAARDRRGAFERAHRGTLFLDELDSMPAQAQVRLLRALEERKVTPMGGEREREADVRVVAASRQSLTRLVEQGTFRPDLYYRLSVVRILLPPLRDRPEDVGPIAAELLRLRGWPEPVQVGGPNLELLRAHGWPGNARELRNILDRALAMSPGVESFGELKLALAPGGAFSGEPGPRTDLPFADAKAEVVERFERRYLADMLERTGGNLSAAAREAGLDRKHLRRLARKHGLVE